MTKITIENYEAFFLDYIEGNLDDARKLELESFLNLHPHLREELEQASSIQLTQEPFVFDAKDALKKFEFDNQSINAATFGDFCIAAHEGLLSERKKEELANFMQIDNTFVKEYISYGKTILKPEDIVYTHKALLYRNTHVVKFSTVLTWGSVAAGLALFIAIYTGLFNTKEIQQPAVVYQTPSNIKINQPKTVAAKEETTSLPVKTIKPKHGVTIPSEYSPKRRNVANVVSANDPENRALDPEIKETVSLIEPEVNGYVDSINLTDEKIAEAESSVGAEGEPHKLLTLIEDGVEKINKVTKSDNLALAHKTSTEGKIKSFSIKLGFIGFERKKARN